MKALFWLSVLFVAYVYAGYPLLLAGWGRLRPRPVARRAPAEWPGVTVVVAARNEGRRLAARLDNLLQLDYPRAALQIVVVSDGSTDDTRDVLARYAGVVDAIQVGQVGKAEALNAGVALARHPLLAFADARQSFAPEALRHLVACFSDPAVGGVSGELVLDTEARPRGSDGESIGEAVGLYWRYEKWLRRAETRVGSSVGASGAIYAIRRSCWRPLPPGTILDDVLTPMRVVLGGWRVVFEPRARAFDRASRDAAGESRRKRRTLAGNYQILGLEPRLLVPGVNPIWLQFVSHKVARLLVPYGLLLALVSSAVLAADGAVYAVALAAQLGLYGLAAYGGILERRALRSERGGRPIPKPANDAAAADSEHDTGGAVNA